MIRLSSLFRRLPALAGALALTALLSACVITSTDLLVSENDAVTPLPATLFLFGYDNDSAGGYARTETPPVSMTLTGKGYLAEDGSLTALFLPLDAPDTYLLAATSKESTIYGIAHYQASILALDVLLGDDVRDAFTAAALPGVTVDGEGVTVADRSALDAAVALVRNGTFKPTPLVFFVADNKDAAAPKSIVADGTGFKAN